MKIFDIISQMWFKWPEVELEQYSVSEVSVAVQIFLALWLIYEEKAEYFTT